MSNDAAGSMQLPNYYLYKNTERGRTKMKLHLVEYFDKKQVGHCLQEAHSKSVPLAVNEGQHCEHVILEVLPLCIPITLLPVMSS